MSSREPLRAPADFAYLANDRRGDTRTPADIETRAMQIIWALTGIAIGGLLGLELFIGALRSLP